jgi:hypothetical protein
MSRIIVFALFIVALIAVLSGYYLWNKPHDTIGKPKFITTAEAIAQEFSEDEDAATKKYVGSNNFPIITEISGTITEVRTDSMGINLNLETGDPINGVSCVIDRFSRQIKTNFQSGEKIKLKGIVTGKLSDVIIDRCVILE